MGATVDDPLGTGPVRVGVVDRRVVVREALAATLAATPGLDLVAVHARWADVDDMTGPVVWVSPTGPPSRAVRRVAVEDLDAGDGAALRARVRAAARQPAAGPSGSRPPGAPVPLSPREDAVLVAVAAGEPAARTAERLGISTRAVQGARRRAITKLGAATQVEAVRRAHELRAAGVELTRGAGRP
jgi:DNA-binding CsgD family transcriptional regulator